MNISNIHNCFGCGLCATVCTRKLIEIQLNENGFYEPVFVGADSCIDCGLCVEVCSYQDDRLALTNEIISSYGAWSKSVEVRKKCSSGGVAFELGKLLLGKGYKVCGVKYDASKELVLHYIANNERELEASIGSKYLQSYTVDAFRMIDRKKKYLVTGSPCQIDSFRRYIRKFKVEDNFVLLDFFCHGVPSMLMWRKYFGGLKSKYGGIGKVIWRDKTEGWHNAYSIKAFSINDGLLHTGLFSKGDAFFRLFLGNGCLGWACYDRCKFRYNQSSADIRIGDAWGTTYQGNELGVNAVIAFTQKGDNLLHEANLVLEVQPFEVIAEGQLKKRIKRIKEYGDIMVSLKDNSKSLCEVVSIMDKHDLYEKLIYKVNLIIHPYKTMKCIMRKLSKWLTK